MRYMNRAAPVEGRQRESSADHHGAQPLWAITSYFNPMRYERRLANYRTFREHLAVPLITVELSYAAEEFDLREGEADILIQLSGRDVLWQKERLLNVGLGALPSECTKVVWLDCDVIFGSGGGWDEEVSGLLDEFVLVQAFSRVHHLPGDLPLGEASPATAKFNQPSVASTVASGLPTRTSLIRAHERKSGTCVNGFAWTARRELLDEHGFYDACIVGGGDRAMAAAAYGIFDEMTQLHSMNERQEGYYLAWVKPYFESVGGAVSFAECDLFHLWHGEMSDRRTRERHEGLGRFRFDAYDHIAIDENGPWRWDSDKLHMHEWVKEYFASRREDG